MEELEIEVLPEAVNEKFFPYLYSQYRYEGYWGGRDSSKSDFVAFKLLLKAVNQEYFKCILIREVADTVKDSQWQTLKDVAEREGLDDFFFFGSSPLVIKCLLNGNIFLARGMDNPKKLKSVKDPTDAWYEETNQISEEAHNIVTTSLRTSHDVPLQEFFTFNPDHEGDYKKFWLYKKFFANTGNENGMSFTGAITAEIEDEVVEMPFMMLHSTYKDNKWCSRERAVTYEAYKHTDDYLYKVWAAGLWTTRRTGAEFYNKFRKEKHVGKYPFLPEQRIIHLTYDFNVLPYMTQIGVQVIHDAQHLKTQVRIFREWCLRPPNNKAAAVTKAFSDEFKGRGISVYYYGDASGKNRIPGKGDERAFDDVYDGLLSGGFLHNTSDRVARRNMNVLKRRDFINDLLEGVKYPDIEICIDESCAETIHDFEVVKQDMYGKVKERVNDTVLGVSYEKVGHASDALDGFFTVHFDYLLP